MNRVALLLTSALILSSTPSFALIIVKGDCTTVDGQYHISVQDHRGIGPVRSQDLRVYVSDSITNQTVAFYSLYYTASRTRFGSSTFIDRIGGNSFILTTGSSHANPTLKVRLTHGKHMDSVITDDKLNCIFYNLDSIQAN